MISEGTRIRIIMALMGLQGRQFAARLGVNPMTVTQWVMGHQLPLPALRQRIVALCHEEGIAFLASGMPVPQSDLNLVKPDIAA